MRAAFDWWEQALALQPRLSDVRAYYAVNGLFCMALDDGRALAELARAVSDDPLSATCAGIYSTILANTGHPEAALAEARRAIDLDPHSFVAAFARIVALVTIKDAGAVAAINETVARFGRHPQFLQNLPRAYVNEGDMRRAEAAYAELRVRSEIDAIPRSSLAIAAAALGHTDEAVQFALESVERCDALNPVWARTPFATDVIRAHPRYPELLRAMGL